MTPEELYDRMYAARPANDALLEEAVLFAAVSADLKPGAQLLDVGCGAGTIAQRLKDLGFSVVGIDHSRVAVDLVEQRGIACHLVDVDRQDLPFGDATFDGAWAGDVLEHVFDPIGLLKKIRRVLKAGGKTYISVPNELPLRTRCRVLLNGQALQRFVYDRYEIDHHHTHFTQDLLELVIHRAGLRPTLLGGVVRVPITGHEFYARNSTLARWFGRTFVATAEAR